MKTKDRIKEEIGFEKLLLTLLIAIISSLSSWTWNNEKVLLGIIATALYSLCFIFAIAAFLSFLKIKLKIKELDKYES